ncbi:hypothetical protein AAG570_005131 [Ranatra chinensis]|uniref:Cytochrome P450 n=1 Tax=Ranatra chinensis TaxID=642074 RepID=A0ABD0YHW2_9HEMI
MKPTWIILDPAIVETVMIKEFSHFHDRGFRIDEKVNPLEGHLFLLNGGKWRALRNKLSPTFTSGKLKWMFSQMDSCSESLLQMIRNEAIDKPEVEVKDIMARFTTDVIGSCAFGCEPTAIKDPDCEFRKMGRRIFNVTLKQLLLNAFRFAFPDVFFRLKLRTIPVELHNFFYSLVRQTFEHRKKTGEKRNDFVELLLQLREKGSIETDPKDYMEDGEKEELEATKEEVTKIELTDDVLTAQAFVFFTAGFETSATSISFTLHLMAKHPQYQDRAREEIRTVKKQHGGRITYAALKEMVYLDACFSEATRLYPPIGILNRECTKTIIMEDGTRIEKGFPVIIPIGAIQIDPDYFPEPHVYNPERFMGGNSPIPGSYMPFGEGPRVCIAKRFALVEAKLGLAKILDRFQLTTSPRMKEPIEMNPRAFILEPKDGIWVKIRELPSEE